MSLIGYNQAVHYTVNKTATFNQWMISLKDAATRRKILARLDRIACGNFGDHKRLAPALYELRLFFGAGYRVYYTIQQGRVVLLLAGGNKASQSKNIQAAQKLITTPE